MIRIGIMIRRYIGDIKRRAGAAFSSTERAPHWRGLLIITVRFHDLLCTRLRTIFLNNIRAASVRFHLSN